MYQHKEVEMPIKIGGLENIENYKTALVDKFIEIDNLDFRQDLKRIEREINKDYKEIMGGVEFSNCCGAPLDISKAFCSDCKEHV